MKPLKIVAAATLFAAASMANAAVNFDPATGQGFVGKGDVQLAYTLNNQDFQKAMANGGFTFSYTVVEKYLGVCTWTTGGIKNQRTHEVEHKITATLISELDSLARKNNQYQFTGFILKGFLSETEIGIPMVGGTCPGNEGHEGTWESFELLSTQGSDQLQAKRTSDGMTATLPITPPALP